jgi:multidrug resistance efflux pump
VEAILLGIYSFFVWLIFIKLKWLPWNTKTQVIVAIIPIVGMAILILLLNIFAPSSADVRVYKYTVPIVSQVKGRVLEVPVEEGNRLVKKGEVLFKIDPQPYQLAVNQLEAQLAGAGASQKELQESQKGAQGKIAETRGAISQAKAKIGEAKSRISEVSAKLDLARLRVDQNRELVKTGAGSKFDLEQAEANLKELEGQLASARSAEAQAQAARATGNRGRAAGSRGRAAGRAETGCADEGRRIRADRPGARPARKCPLGTRADNDRLALRLLRDQSPVAAGRFRRGDSIQCGHDAG